MPYTEDQCQSANGSDSRMNREPQPEREVLHSRQPDNSEIID